MNKIDKILEQELEKINPGEIELARIKKETREIIEKLEKSLRGKKIKASVFLGGSLAKGTLIKKKNYDIDIFVRFSENKDISEKLGKLIKATRIHGSRDYFHLNKGNLLFEIIPVLKISKPEDARNITDLSYFHVNYVLNKIKKKPKIAGEIMLAKAFCYSQKCYGAESYINGFSGYALELLVSYYGSFLKFIEQVSRAREKIVIDPEKFYKNKQEILNSVNESKLASPIVFVDPTFKARNAVAALSQETFARFQEASSRFLKKPSGKFFQENKIDEKKFNLIIELATNKQEGDIAGSKLLKFSRFLARNFEKYFNIKSKDFEYSGEKDGRFYLKIDRKKEIIYPGPPVNKPERLLSFKQAHKQVFIKQGKSFAKEKSLAFSDFWRKFLIDNKKIMKDMGITRLRVIKK